MLSKKVSYLGQEGLCCQSVFLFSESDSSILFSPGTFSLTQIMLVQSVGGTFPACHAGQLTPRFMSFNSFL